MNWQALLDAKRVQPYEPGRRDIDDLRAVVDRDLKDADIAGLSADRRFATSYNAALQLARIAVACAGYRVTARGGHHKASFEALVLAVGPAVSGLADYLDTCRRKRNVVDYDMAHRVSETEADELQQKAREFQRIVEDWVAQAHPQFALAPPSE